MFSVLSKAQDSKLGMRSNIDRCTLRVPIQPLLLSILIVSIKVLIVIYLIASVGFGCHLSVLLASCVCGTSFLTVPPTCCTTKCPQVHCVSCLLSASRSINEKIEPRHTTTALNDTISHLNAQEVSLPPRDHLILPTACTGGHCDTNLSDHHSPNPNPDCAGLYA